MLTTKQIANSTYFAGEVFEMKVSRHVLAEVSPVQSMKVAKFASKSRFAVVNEGYMALQCVLPGVDESTFCAFPRLT